MRGARNLSAIVSIPGVYRSFTLESVPKIINRLSGSYPSASLCARGNRKMEESLEERISRYPRLNLEGDGVYYRGKVTWHVRGGDEKK